MPLCTFRRTLAVGSAAVALLASPVAAQTLQFGATACGGTGFVLSGSTFSESGFTLVTTGSYGFASWCSTRVDYPGSPALFINTSGSSALLTKAGGGAFSIQSIDLTKLFSSGSPGAATFTGTMFGGGSVSTTFNYSAPSGAPVFATFAFGAGWNNVTDVSWNQSGNFNTGHQFDNVVLADAVTVTPEPTSLALLATGLVLFGASRRRHAGDPRP